MIRRATTTAAAALLLLGAVVPASADVDLGGVPIDPSTDRRAPTVLQAGTWSDTLGPAGGDDSTHYVAYRRTMRFSTVHVGVAGANAAESSTVTLDVTTPEGESCGSDTATSGATNQARTFGAGVAVGPEDLNDACLLAGELRIAIGRGFGTSEAELPVALRVVEEAPANDGAQLPEPSPTPRVSAPDDSPAEATTGATSYADAPYLDPGAHDTTVAEGEERLWRVRLDWGQQVSVRVVLPPKDAAAEAALELDTAAVELVLLDPLLNSFGDAVEGAEGAGRYGDERVLLVEGSPEVGFRNRFDDGYAAVPGDYWVALSVEPADERDAFDVPMTIAVEVLGERTGAPTYPRTVQDPVGDAGPADYDPARPFLVGVDQFSADVSGSPRGPDADPRAEDDATRETVGLVVGAVSLLCVVAGLVLLVRRRRLSRPAAR